MDDARKLTMSSEDAEQEGVIQWARMLTGRYPELALLHHIPNEGKRSSATGRKLQRLGVLAGVPDLHLPVAKAGYYSLYIEMKYGNNRLQKTQKEFLTAAAAEDNYCVVCYTAEDAIGVIEDYLHNLTSWPNLSIIKGGKRSGTVKQP